MTDRELFAHFKRIAPREDFRSFLRNTADDPRYVPEHRSAANAAFLEGKYKDLPRHRRIWANDADTWDRANGVPAVGLLRLEPIETEQTA